LVSKIKIIYDLLCWIQKKLKKDIETEARTEPVGNYQIFKEEELRSASNQEMDTPGEIDGYRLFQRSLDHSYPQLQ